MGVLRKLDKPKGWKPESYSKVINLIKVEGGENNNKYYDMYDTGNGEWIACYGRVDATQMTETHPMNEWDSKYKSKLKKGYQDVTHLRTIKESKSSTTNEVIDIKNPQVKKFVEDLQGYSNRSIKDNYTVTAADVTQAQVDEAQSILDRLVAKANFKQNTDYINSDLLSLYRTIPRRMKNVRDHLLNFSEIKNNDNLSIFKNIISNEQLTLDVMRGQVAQIVNVAQASTKKIDVLAAMGLTIEIVNDKEIQLIKKLLGSNANQFSKAFKIINNKTQTKFDSFVSKRKNKTTDLLWHGSRNENWWSIIDTGLVLRPTNAVITGKMFGLSLYFAPKAQKSIGYTSLRGSYWSSGKDDKAYLALYNVHTGNNLHILGSSTKYKHHEYWMSQLTEKRLKDIGDYDSVYAEKGYDLRNDEWMIYNENQCSVKYIVEIVK